MPDRRYTDEEARRILALATEAEATGVPTALEGWTLAELQAAGTEVGLAPDVIAGAALALDRATAPSVRMLGLPVTVSHAVALPRALSDEDWERLVWRLRDTFGAQGKVHVAGGRREWRVGNLRVTHEPTADGALLDLRTRKGGAGAIPAAGLALTTAASAGAFVLSAQGDAAGLMMMAFGAVAGVTAVVGGLARLPFWARLRARQFDSLGSFARRLIGAG